MYKPLKRTLIPALLLSFAVSASAIAQEQATADELGAAFLAKVLGSAVFVSGRDVDEALKNSIYPFMQLNGNKPEDISVLEVDKRRGEIRMAVLDSPVRTARYFGDQGCVIIPSGADDVHFESVKLESTLPVAESTPWPMGDAPSDKPLPENINADKLAAAVKAAFEPKAHTAAFVVVYDGNIIAEQYAEGAHKDMPLESWSMGKSLTAILYGLLAHQDGDWDPFVPAPVPEWQKDGDPRKAIQVADLFHMSSGLEFTSRDTPPSTWEQAHPDHTYIYSGAIDAFAFSVNQPLEFPPNTVGRYRNCDPLTVGYLVRRKVEARGENYLSFPRRALFDKIGIRNMVLEPDPYGNFLLTGYDFGSARDWARLGLLMINDGVWQGERLLPEGFAEFVSTPAPAWDNAGYGGLFWLDGYGENDEGPKAYRAAGQGGQSLIIVPELDLVVARMGHQSGGAHSGRATRAALEQIIAAIGP